MNQSVEVASFAPMRVPGLKQLEANTSMIKLKSKQDIVHKLRVTNDQLPKRFRLMPVDLENISNSKTLALEDWNNNSPSGKWLMDQKKVQRRQEYWDSKVKDDVLPKLNKSVDTLKKRPRFKR